jgi:hypothetical protein
VLVTCVPILLCVPSVSTGNLASHPVPGTVSQPYARCSVVTGHRVWNVTMPVCGTVSCQVWGSDLCALGTLCGCSTRVAARGMRRGARGSCVGHVCGHLLAARPPLLAVHPAHQPGRFQWPGTQAAAMSKGCYNKNVFIIAPLAMSFTL